MTLLVLYRRKCEGVAVQTLAAAIDGLVLRPQLFELIQRALKLREQFFEAARSRNPGLFASAHRSFE